MEPNQTKAELIDNAPPALELPADRLLRGIVGWSAIVYGGLAVAGTIVQLALAKGWAASPPTMAWGFHSTTDMVLDGLAALFMIGLLISGVTLLRRSRMGISLLRASAASSIVLLIIGQVWAVESFPTYGSYWSKPATATIELLRVSDGLWLPILFMLLTLPPLARRMV